MYAARYNTRSSATRCPNDVFPCVTTDAQNRHMQTASDVLRVGVGGPVGSGKTALVDLLCKNLRDRVDMAVVTNDIYTREDANFLVRSQALTPDRIRGVETGGCPHTAIREDASMNLSAIDELMQEFPGPRPDHRRKRWRQPRRDLQPGTVRPDPVRHRRRRGRQDSAQGRPGHHALGPADHQQDRPRASCGRVPGGDGPGCTEDARRPAVRVHEPQDRHGLADVIAFILDKGMLTHKLRAPERVASRYWLSSRTARATAEARFSTPSFTKTCSRCLFTVRGLIPRIAPISRLDLPRDSHSSTAASRAVRPSASCRRPLAPGGVDLAETEQQFVRPDGRQNRELQLARRRYSRAQVASPDLPLLRRDMSCWTRDLGRQISLPALGGKHLHQQLARLGRAPSDLAGKIGRQQEPARRIQRGPLAPARCVRWKGARGSAPAVPRRRWAWRHSPRLRPPVRAPHSRYPKDRS